MHQGVCRQEEEVPPPVSRSALIRERDMLGDSGKEEIFLGLRFSIETDYRRG